MSEHLVGWPRKTKSGTPVSVTIERFYERIEERVKAIEKSGGN